MKRIILALFALAFASATAFAQSNPGLTYGQVPTAGQWNSYFSAKQDTLGYTPVNRAGDTMFGPLKTFAPNGASAGLIVTPGLVPSAPTNGSIWFTASGMFIQVNSATVGPIGGGSTSVLGPNSSTVGHIATWNNTSGSLLADGGKSLPAGAIVGTTDSQTLTNKSIDASQINSGTLPSARMPALTGDCTTTSGTVATTCTKLNGVSPGTAYPLNVGTSANNVVQLNGSSQLPAVSGANLTGLPSVPVRETALSGPQSSGLPSFLPATSGSLSITSQNISTGVNALVVTAAGGQGANGAINAVGAATSNQTWSSLTASTTNYLGETVGVGTLTTLSTATQPGAQCSGTIPVTSGQYTFDTCGYQMYLGNGSVANPVSVTFVGEAVTSGSAVTSTVAYAYQGKYDTGFIATIPAIGTLTTFNANIGSQDVTVALTALVTTGNNGYSVGDLITNPITTVASGTPVPFPLGATRNTAWFTTGGTSAIAVVNKTTGVSASGTAANFSYRLTAKRNY